MEAKVYTELTEHPLKAGRYVLILHGTPLTYIGSKGDCEAMKARWDKKVEQLTK